MPSDLVIKAQPILGQGALSRKARRILHAYGNKAVAASFRLRIHKFETSEGAVIVTIVCDDSTSAKQYREALQHGLNTALARLKATIPGGAIVNLKAMNAAVPWVNCVPLSVIKLPVELGYQEDGRTPLWRATLEALALAIELCKELGHFGTPATSVTIIATDDQGDTMSAGLKPQMVAKVLADMRDKGHRIWGMGAGNRDAYTAILLAMGILPEDIFSANDGYEIEATLVQFAQLALTTHLAITTGPDK